jgi:hypothetical protein
LTLDGTPLVAQEPNWALKSPNPLGSSFTI